MKYRRNETDIEKRERERERNVGGKRREKERERDALLKSVFAESSTE